MTKPAVRQRLQRLGGDMEKVMALGAASSGSRYQYKGKAVTVKELAGMANVSIGEMRWMLKEHGFDADKAMSAYKNAENEIMDILGYDIAGNDEPAQKQEEKPKPAVCKEVTVPAIPIKKTVPTEKTAPTEKLPDKKAMPEVRTAPATAKLDAEDKRTLRCINVCIRGLKTLICEVEDLDDSTIVLLDDAAQRLQKVRRELYDEMIDWEGMAK